MAKQMPNISSTARKALNILESFTDHPDGLTLSQLAASNQLNKTTAIRLCRTLEAAGFLERDSRMKYQVGHKIWQLAQVYDRKFNLEEVVRPALRSLRDASGESASFYVKEGKERACVFRENSKQLVRHHLEEGVRLPLMRGVVGRVLLAFSGEPGAQFDRIRRNGYLIDRGREPDTASVAAPLMDSGGKSIGAIVISGPKSRFDHKRQFTALKAVLAACAAISEIVPSRAEPTRAPKPRARATRSAARQKPRIQGFAVRRAER